MQRSTRMGLMGASLLAAAAGLTQLSASAQEAERSMRGLSEASQPVKHRGPTTVKSDLDRRWERRRIPAWVRRRYPKRGWSVRQGQRAACKARNQTRNRKAHR